MSSSCTLQPIHLTLPFSCIAFKPSLVLLCSRQRDFHLSPSLLIPLLHALPAGVFDSLFERLAKAEAEAHEQRSSTDRKGKRPPGPFPRFGARLVHRLLAYTALSCPAMGSQLQLRSPRGHV